MSMSEVNYYKYYMKNSTPAWMKSERYEYCEPFHAGMLSMKPVKKKKSFIQTLLAALF